MASASDSGDPPPAFVLEPMDRVARADPRSQTALRTRSSPAGQAAQSRQSRSPKAGWPQRWQSGPATGSQRDRQSSQTSASPWREGTGASHRRHAGGRSQRSTPASASAKRGIDRGAHDLDRRPHAGKPALERRGALRHQHGAAVGRPEARARAWRAPTRVSPRAYTMSSATARPCGRGGSSGSGSPRVEAERRGVDDGDACRRARRLARPTPRRPVLEAAAAGRRSARRRRPARPARAPRPPRPRAPRRRCRGSATRPAAPPGRRGPRAGPGRRCCRRPFPRPRPRTCCRRRAARPSACGRSTGLARRAPCAAP